MARLLLALNGSPLASSSVTRMLEAACEGARDAGGTSVHVRCVELHVRACVACGPNATDGWCIFHDDMDAVYDAIERAHAIVVGSPVYFDTVSAPLKAVIDRCNCVTPLVRRPDGSEDLVPKLARTRRGAFVTACSDAHPHELAERTVRGFLKWVGARWEETIAWRHADSAPGSVPDELVATARALGRRLVESEPHAG